MSYIDDENTLIKIIKDFKGINIIPYLKDSQLTPRVIKTAIWEAIINFKYSIYANTLYP